MKQTETKYAIIHYNNDEIFNCFLKNITPFSFGNWFRKPNLFCIDKLYERVQKVLGIDSESSTKITIKLFANRKNFVNEYNRLYGKTNKKLPRSLYDFYYKVIYVNVKDISEGMLAHEFTHPIFREYFRQAPPRVLAEILATYVESHLHDKIKKY
ncbi:hypothetical protein LCGC14_1130540 [marine sediment metagenome]|uniref:DUF2268 domain-containing protein n=1 Tax=marine sediment metagenome TaxID=412755 RepID=A0A0F9M161_9ZZZZ